MRAPTLVRGFSLGWLGRAGTSFQTSSGGVAISPGSVLAILVVLITTQFCRLLVPPAVPYLVSLLLAGVGLLAGEIVAQVPGLAGPMLGVLHPVPDLGAIAAVEIAGSVAVGRRFSVRPGG